MQQARNVGPNLFACNENIAHIMPHVTACAMTSCMHRAAHARRQAGHPMYMWHARNYLCMCHSRKPNNIIKINCLTFWHPKFKICKPECAGKDSCCHAQQEQGRLQ